MIVLRGIWTCRPRLTRLLQSLYLCARALKIDTQLRENSPSHSLAVADQAEKHMLRSNVVIIELACLIIRQVDHALCARGELHILA